MLRATRPVLFTCITNAKTTKLRLQKPKSQQEKLNSILPSVFKDPTQHISPTQQLHSLSLTTLSLLPHYYHFATQLLNTLIKCYSLTNKPQHAFLLYKQAQELLYLPSFDSFTYTFLINTASNCGFPIMGIQLHGVTLKIGFHCHVYVQTALISMYVANGMLSSCIKVFDEMPERNLVTWNVLITGLVKWGEIEHARSFFDEMSMRNVVSWTGIIDGYVRGNRFHEGLGLFRRMVSSEESVKPSEITLLAILPAVWNLGNLKVCNLIHGHAEKLGFIADIRVANSFVDTYAKCGCIFSAVRFFEGLDSWRKNLVTWTSIISGYALHGLGKEAVESFETMVEEGLKPNRVTFLSLLNACSHGGLVKEGLRFFETMKNEEYGIVPDIKHYGCVVDMLGRTGRLEEAEKLALSIPSEIFNVVIWRTILGACSFHGNVEMGQRVSQRIMELEKDYGGDYALMYNLFTGVGRFDDAEKLRRLMDERHAFKDPGHSLV